MINDIQKDTTDQLENFPLVQILIGNSVELNDEALSAARAEELNRSYIESLLPRGFRFGKDGWLVYEKEGEEGGSPPIVICSGLEVAAHTRDQYGENHGRLLRFYDSDGLLHEWPMPMELLAGDSATYREVLMSKGLLINPGKAARDLLTKYILLSSPSLKMRCVDQTGWSTDHTAFVLQKRVIGRSTNEPLILQTASSFPITQSQSGTLENWQQMAALCQGNSRLTFAVSAAFAPPLLMLLGIENGGIHFRGGSSSGKTTCLRVAASVWGGHDYVQQWRATANGLEGTAAAHNDCLLCLDEMGQMAPEEVGNVAYMLANGMGKTRADKLGDSRKRKTWRLLFLSSGEIGLADHMSAGKQQLRAGQEVRVLDIPADDQRYGCFQKLHGRDQGKDFAEYLGEQCKLYFGTAGPKFVEFLLQEQTKIIQEAKKEIHELSKKHVPLTASGQVHRAFNRFALIAIAGELATKFGITGWSAGAAIDAAVVCFNDWLSARGDMRPQEEKAILSQARHFFEQHGESRFTPWLEDEIHSKTLFRAGFRRKCKDEGGEEYFVFPETFKKDVAVGFDPSFFAKICIENGLLVSDNNGRATRSERLPGNTKSTRVYRFTSKVLMEGEEVAL